MDATVIALSIVIIFLAMVNVVLMTLLLTSPYRHYKSREYQEMLGMKEDGIARLVNTLRQVDDLKKLINGRKGHDAHIENRVDQLEEQIQRLINALADVGISKREQ